MPIALQAKLLRVLQENVVERLGGNHSIPLDVRIVVASNQNPRQAIQDGKLREDLYYRVNVFNIDLPALRERKEDIPDLAAAFLQQHGGSIRLSAAALASLQDYSWPGNVRELQNVIERAAVLCRNGLINVEQLPREMTESAQPASIAEAPRFRTLQLNPAVDQLEHAMIKEALMQTGGNKSKAARLLDISERSLWYKLKKLGLERAQ